MLALKGLLLASSLALPQLALSESCRCLSGENCWPSASDFSQLASTLSVPLLSPVPPESACYPPANPSGNCTEVTLNTFDGVWRSTQPGSMQSPNFETYVFKNGTIDAYYLNTTLGQPCRQGSVPVIGVDARSVADIQAAVKFASTHDLRLVVKNTGWGLAIELSNVVDNDNFAGMISLVEARHAAHLCYGPIT